MCHNVKEMVAWFHKQWGRGNYSNLWSYGKKAKCQKGKPIKLSTTLFVFYAQSSKIGEGSYCLGMGKVWRSNSNLGSYPFLENVSLASWASKCWEMPSQAIIHPCVCFLTQLEIAREFSLMFLLFPSFFPLMGIQFGQCSVAGILYGHFCCGFPHCRSEEIPFLFCSVNV